MNGSSEADNFFAEKEIDAKPHLVLADSWFLNDHNFHQTTC